MCTHDCIVEADINVVIVSAYFFNAWDVRIVLVLRRSDYINFNTKVLCFCCGLLCPDTSFDVSSFFPVDTKVLCDHGKLC